MKFSPIIHNLNKNDIGYKECQLYNSLIGNKPTGGMTLTSKLSQIKAWEDLCSQALEKAQSVLKGF